MQNFKINKSRNFKRFIVITCLVTFLFLPFSRPQKAQAFAPAIPIIAELLPYVGAGILALAGCSFVSTEMAKHEGNKLIEEYGDLVLFKVKPFFGSAYWVKGSEMWDDDWSRWTKEFRIDESFYEKFDEIKASIPVDGILSVGEIITKDNYLNFSSVTGSNDSLTINNINFIKTSGVLHFVNINNVTYNPETFDISSLNSGVYDVRKKVYGTNFSNTYLEILEPGTTNIVTRFNCRIGNGLLYPGEGVEMEKQKEIPYTPDITAGMSKDKLMTSLPVDSSMDISNVKEFPLTADDVSAENGYVGDVASGDVITGWKWLDDILNAILDAILSIPGAIKDGIASLFVPTLSFSDSIDKLKSKLGLPNVTFPNFSNKVPLSFTVDFQHLGKYFEGYKFTVTLDQPWWPMLRAILLGFEMLGIIGFAYRKVTSLHGGEGD